MNSFSLCRLLKSDVRVFSSLSFFPPLVCICNYSVLLFSSLLFLLFIKNLIQQMNLNNYTGSFPLTRAELLLFPVRLSSFEKKKIRNHRCCLSEKMRLILSAQRIIDESNGELTQRKTHTHTCVGAFC